MHPNKKVFVTFLSFVLAIVVIACLCSPTPVPPTVTSTPPNPMPGLAGTWNSPDTGDVYEIAWQGGQYVVVSCIWEGTSYDITSQSWNGSSLIWSYNDSDMGQTVTLTTTSLSGDSLDVDWSLSDGSSGTTTLQRGGGSSVTPESINQEAMPGLAGTWQGLETLETYVIAWQNGQYVVLSALWQGTSYDITSQSWNGSSLTWSYYDSYMDGTITLTTTSLSGDSLNVDWSVSNGGSRTEILQRLVDKVVDLGEAEMKDPDLAMFVDTPEWGPVPANQVLVLLDDTQGEADAQLLAQQLGGTIVGSFDYINLWQIEFPSGSADDLRAALTTAAAASGVTSVFPNSLITLDACNDAFDDPVFAGGAAAPYERIGVSAAWDYLKASGVPLSNVHIGLVDSALMLKDPNGRITSEFDNVSFPHGAGSTTDYWTDDEGYTINNGIWHANGVLGQIAGDMDDGGMVGIASPLGKQLSIEHTDIYRPGSVTDQSYPLDPELAEALGPKSAATTGRLMLDLKKQIEKGATIINGSFGPVHTGALNGFEAIAWKKFLGKIGTEHPEVLFVFSAGNEGVQNNGSNTWPGGIKLPNVMTVGSVQSDSTTTNYSNRTDPNGVGEVTLAAPGDQAMWGTGADGSIVNTDGGTSSAAPMVTAAAALVRAVDPSLSAEQIKILLEVTSDTGPADVGGKILRVDKAVLTAINTKRALAGLTPDLKAEDLKGLCEVQLSFKRIGLIEGWVEYEVTATLPKVGPAGSEVRIELGSNSVGGHGADPQKVTSSGGSVTFNVAGSQEGFGVIVTRLDTGAKARHYFQPDLTPTPEVTPTAAHQPRNACVGVTLADFHDNHINAIKCSLTCFLVGGPAPSDAEILDCIAKNSEP